jgi:hypothetical protein
MLHPFLILPAIGVITLGKIAYSNLKYNPGISIILFLFILIVAAAIIYFIIDGPLHPIKRKQPRPWIGAALDMAGGVDGLVNMGAALQGMIPGRNAPFVPLDRARAIFDIHILQDFDFRPGVHIERNNVKNDVHDHEIQNSLRLSVEKLREWYKTVENSLPKEQIIAQIKEYIFNGYEGEYRKKEDAYSTIRSIEKTNGTLASVKMSELEILCMVWQRVVSDVNTENASEIKSNLLELLADSTIRLDSPYCLVGRITRMVQSLESLDQEGIINIRSTDVVENEIQNKIPVLINDFFSLEEFKERKEAYDQGDDVIALVLRQYVDQELRKDYQETGVLTDTKYSEIVDRYLEELV